ncbi:MFS transporter [Crenobacter sp. SG2303]|uniref:MFS transporter n=1 Tax=Crenobacter oryzisoli TaxID=3056844 RepID=A0ABT7XUC6_9NEIS|nr:MFS transporter [Crenobacter sp. SG2303]MDN0077400.1 MFS transporter [Crenobacter sp. SG2303]
MALFFASDLPYATWGIHIPTIRERFSLSDATLSLAMFAVAGGAILAMGPVGRWVVQVGTARAVRLAAWPFSLAIGTLMLPPSFATLLPLLLAFSIANASYDVAMNAQAATVEAAHGRPIMSSLHGMFSMGGMVGALAGGGLISLGVSPWLHCAAVGLFVLLATRLGFPHLLPEAPPTVTTSAEHAHHAGRRLWWIGGLAFLGLVGEGAMYDWTSVYMRDVALSPAALAAAGYAAFSGGMALGRFGGDWLRIRFGARALLTGSGWTGFIGVALALLLPYPLVALLGFTLMGLGAANMVPLFFVAASRLDGVPPAEGITAVSRLAYVGMLLGPVLIGALAHATDSLRIGLALVALAIGLIAVCGVRFLPAETAR